MKIDPRIFMSIVAWITTATVLVAEDWPAWRGPRGDGISKEVEAPLHWSPVSNIRWRTALPGVGLSSPIVHGSNVYITAFIPATHERQLIQFDRNSGKIQWSTVVHTGEVENQHKFNTSASSTPVTDGDRVYTVFVDSSNMIIAAVDKKGSVCWKRVLGTYFSKHGFAASPILCKEGIVVNGHQDGDAFIALLDPSTGESKWTYEPTTKIRSFSTPLLVDVDGKSQVVVAGSNETLAIDPKTGQKIWYALGPTEKVVCTPSAGHGHVFCFGGSPITKAFALKLGGVGDITQSHQMWQREKGMPYVPSPLLYKDFLHVVDDLGIYTCLDPITGKVLKTLRKGGNTYSSPIGVAERVYLFDDSGSCTIIANNNGFEVLAKNDLGELVQSTPAISDKKLFVRSENHLWCIGE